MSRFTLCLLKGNESSLEETRATTIRQRPKVYVALGLLA